MYKSFSKDLQFERLKKITRAAPLSKTSARILGYPCTQDISEDRDPADPKRRQKIPSRWVRERKADMVKVSVDIEHVANMESAKI
jgi:hypothetical protein